MSLRHFLDYYRGRISYTEAINMPFKVYHTFTYIMYRENIEREKKEKARQERERIEEQNRADAERRIKEQEKAEQQMTIKTGREAIMERVRKNNSGLIEPKMPKNTISSTQKPLPEYNPQFPLPAESTAEDMIEMFEDGV